MHFPPKWLIASIALSMLAACNTNVDMEAKPVVENATTAQNPKSLFGVQLPDSFEFTPIVVGQCDVYTAAGLKKCEATARKICAEDGLNYQSDSVVWEESSDPEAKTHHTEALCGRQ